MVIMRPTSVVVAGAGSSASVRAAGGVEFASATSLSLNGVFTSDFDDYMIVVRCNADADRNIQYRLRLSGADSSTGYTRQFFDANGSSVNGARQTSQTIGILGSAGSNRSGFTGYLYGPALAQPTATRSVTIWDSSGARIADEACTHSVSTAYDGITLISSAGSITGLVTVYGLAQ